MYSRLQPYIFQAATPHPTHPRLLELSKSFLDPFGNEGSDGQEEFIRTDTLLAECNSASTRWWRGAERLPFDTLPFDAERHRQ